MKKNPQWINKSDKQIMVASLSYERITFPVSKKPYHKIGTKSNVSTNVFGNETNQLY